MQIILRHSKEYFENVLTISRFFNMTNKKIDRNFLYSIFENIEKDKFNLDGTIYWKYTVDSDCEHAFDNFKQISGMSLPAVQRIPSITVDVTHDGELTKGNYIVSNKNNVSGDVNGTLTYTICNNKSYFYFFKL